MWLRGKQEGVSDDSACQRRRDFDRNRQPARWKTAELAVWVLEGVNEMYLVRRFVVGGPHWNIKLQCPSLGCKRSNS